MAGERETKDENEGEGWLLKNEANLGNISNQVDSQCYTIFKKYTLLSIDGVEVQRTQSLGQLILALDLMSFTL